MKTVWNQGLTKGSHSSVLRISEARRKIDNFKAWRDRMRDAGIIKSEYYPFEKDGNLAELIGVVLGDGHIARFLRCDCLRITANGDNVGFVRRYSRLVRTIFGKEPAVAKVRASKAVTITLYEKQISSRLGIPHGSRHNINYVVPRWISLDRNHVLRFLRGLYEAEGSYNVHAPTYTHKFQFSNANESLLNAVFELVKTLGFHPHLSYRQVQVSRKDEVQMLKNLLEFRRY